MTSFWRLRPVTAERVSDLAHALVEVLLVIVLSSLNSIIRTHFDSYGIKESGDN
jgi:hypothetical protein